MKIPPAAIDSLWQRGYGHLGRLLDGKESEDIRGLYADETKFRSRIDMARSTVMWSRLLSLPCPDSFGHVPV